MAKTGGTAEHARLTAARDGKTPWKKWGPYLSERQWGTVREDYSQNGDAWNFFTHDHARSRAYSRSSSIWPHVLRSRPRTWRRSG